MRFLENTNIIPSRPLEIIDELTISPPEKILEKANMLNATFQIQGEPIEAPIRLTEILITDRTAAAAD